MKHQCGQNEQNRINDPDRKLEYRPQVRVADPRCEFYFAGAADPDESGERVSD
jgi:hypothetical protein